MLTAQCFLVCNIVTAGSLLMAGYFYQAKLLEAPSPLPRHALQAACLPQATQAGRWRSHRLSAQTSFYTRTARKGWGL